MNEICPIILNTEFEQLGVIDDYISLIWTSRYYGCGDFEICLPVGSLTANNFLIQQGYYIMRSDDRHVGIVEDIKYQRSEDLKEICIVKGRFLSSIIGRRIIGKQTQVSGTPQACIQTLMNQNILNPSDAVRKIASLQFKNDSTCTKRMNAQYTGKNLLTVIEEICVEYGIGFETLLTDDNKFQFRLFDGVDRSYNQSVNPYVVFSDEFDNLLSSEYEENYYNTVTSVMVGGEGEGTDRKVVWSESGANTLITSNVIANGGTGWTYSSGTMTCTDGGFRIKGDQFVEGQTYTIAFTIKKTGGTFVSIGGDSSAFIEGEIKVNDVVQSATWSEGVPIQNNTSNQTVQYTFTYNTDQNTDFFFKINRGATSNSASWQITNLKLAVGTELVQYSGINRYELFKDARNATTNNGAIPDNIYLQQLRQEGLESITKFTKAFNGTVYFGAVKYKEDINVGDICVIENTRWGLNINARLVEVIESVAESGAYSIVPTFAV